MHPRIKKGYIGVLLLSVLLYGLPFEWGGYALRIILGIVLLALGIYVAYITWKETNPSVRINHLLWLINSTALFHLVLIYIYLMLDSTFTLLIGLVLGAVFYFIVSNHIKNTF